LFWETIKASHQEGYQIYDFGRTGSASSDLIHFKNHWGTQSQDLPSYITPIRQNQNKMVKEFSLKYNLVKQICRISPQPIYQIIGKVVYHHIG
jgi:CelD/BcsL family acetyltransferase involved in cellulose biosynthesis